MLPRERAKCVRFSQVLRRVARGRDPRRRRRLFRVAQAAQRLELGLRELGALAAQAGAFGAHISPKHAMVLGMIPDCPIDKVYSAGNAAGTGARIALLNSAARREIESVVRLVEKVETAVEPKFQEHFVNAIAVPHKTDPFPLLREVAPIPVVNFGASGGGGENAGDDGGRRRRRRPRA